MDLLEYKGKKLRNELKYIINVNEYQCLKARLTVALPKDKYNGEDGYHIRSLYFDDIYQSAFSEKINGVEFRQKYRIRIYNKSDSLIKLERKEKYNQFISKQFFVINKEQYYALTQGGDMRFLINSEKEVSREMYCAIKTRLLAPAVIADYTREAFVLNEGNVRITFDQNLQACINTCDIFGKEIFTVNALEPGTIILEVKFDDYLPAYVKKLLQIPASSRESASKFLYCRDTQLRFNPSMTSLMLNN